MRRRELNTIVDYLRSLSEPGKPARLTIKLEESTEPADEAVTDVDIVLEPVFVLYDSAYPMGRSLSLDRFATTCVWQA